MAHRARDQFRQAVEGGEVGLQGQRAARAQRLELGLEVYDE